MTPSAHCLLLTPCASVQRNKSRTQDRGDLSALNFNSFIFLLESCNLLRRVRFLTTSAHHCTLWHTRAVAYIRTRWNKNSSVQRRQETQEQHGLWKGDNAVHELNRLLALQRNPLGYGGGEDGRAACWSCFSFTVCGDCPRRDPSP